ncbi:MAG: hypothetical protein R2838_23900 [Caldilineaceae bacterium]
MRVWPSWPAGRLKSKQGAAQTALEGQMDDHHRFMLTHELALFDFLSAQIEQMNSASRCR